MTSFSQGNFNFSHAAHMAARDQFYSKMWPTSVFTFTDTTKAAADLDYAVDCIADVNLPDSNARAPVKFFIQERWRRPGNVHYKDITITEWNTRTNQPSELYKLGAQLFVYGYYDQANDRVIDAVAIDVCKLQFANIAGNLDYIRQKRGTGDQTFITVKLDHLDQIGATLFALNASKSVEDLRWKG